MIRWFRNWRARRRQRFCAYVRALGVHASDELRAQIWAECEAELLAEVERPKHTGGLIEAPATYVVDEFGIHLRGKLPVNPVDEADE